MIYICNVTEEFCNSGGWSYTGYQQWVAFDTKKGGFWWDDSPLECLAHLKVQGYGNDVKKRLLPYIDLAKEVITPDSHPEYFI